MVTITNQDLLDCGCDQSDCEGLIDVAREIDGVEISLMLREKRMASRAVFALAMKSMSPILRRNTVEEGIGPLPDLR